MYVHLLRDISPRRGARRHPRYEMSLFEKDVIDAARFNRSPYKVLTATTKVRAWRWWMPVKGWKEYRYT